MTAGLEVAEDMRHRDWDTLKSAHSNSILAVQYPYDARGFKSRLCSTQIQRLRFGDREFAFQRHPTFQVPRISWVGVKGDVVCGTFLVLPPAPHTATLLPLILEPSEPGP